MTSEAFPLKPRAHVQHIHKSLYKTRSHHTPRDTLCLYFSSSYLNHRCTPGSIAHIGPTHHHCTSFESVKKNYIVQEDAAISSLWILQSHHITPPTYPVQSRISNKPNASSTNSVAEQSARDRRALAFFCR